MKIYKDRIVLTGLLLFGLSLPLSKSINTIVMVGIYIYLITLYLYKKQQVSLNLNQPLLIPVLLFLLPPVIGILYSQNTFEAFKTVKRLSNLFFIYLLFSSVMSLRDFRHHERVLLSYVAGLFLLDLIGFMQYMGFIGNAYRSIPLRPLGIHHIWLGNLNAIGVYVSLCLFMLRPSWRPYLAGFIVIFIITIVMSVSRTAWVGLSLSTVVFFYLNFKKKKPLFLILSVFILLVGGTLAFNNVVYERLLLIYTDIQKYFSGDPNTSVGARLLMWKAAWKMFALNPLFGVGTGDYVETLSFFVKRKELPEFLLHFNHPHNLYLNSLATNGLIGILSLLYLFWRILKYSRNLLRHPRMYPFGQLALLSTVHFMSAGLTEALFNIHMLLCTFAFITGVCIRHYRDDHP